MMKIHKKLNTVFSKELSNTIEEKTKLGHDLKVKKEIAIDDEKSSELFLEMIDRLEKNDFIHYKISNFGNVQNSSGRNFLRP